MKLFIADLGLRLAGPASCKLESGKINSEISAAAKTSIAQSLAKPEEISPPPAVYQPPPSTTTKTSTKSTQRNSPESAAALSRRGGPISAEKAKSAIDALYQAILWRAPDERGGAEAIKRMTEAGWSAYVSNAKKMVRSREFLQDVEPNHTPQQIINRIYAIYMGRCAFKPELERALNDLSSKGPGDVVGGIIQTARRRNAEQILSGGFSPSTCVE